MSKRFTYIDTDYQPNPNIDVVTTLYVESVVPLKDAAEALAAESSTGTWTSVGTMTESVYEELSAKVFYINEISRIIKVAYPISLFETDNIPQLLSCIAGNIFGLKGLNNLLLMDVELPNRFLADNPGPAKGIQGIREYLRVFDRPLLGSIIKPKVGLSPKEHARVAYEAWVGGVDLIKDDENLTDQPFCPFNERLKITLEMKKKAEEVTGEKKIYAPNVSGSADEMCERVETVKKLGGECVMIDFLTVGFAGLQYIRRQNFDLIIHGHRTMHGAITNNPSHGISMLVLAKLARLAGVDELHTGTVIGKMEGNQQDVTIIDRFLKSNWGNILPTMPVASGGLHPGHVPELVKIVGKDVIINMGGGIHGHPEGTRKGATAARQSLEAACLNIPIKKYALRHRELAEAIEKWGIFGEEKYAPPITHLSRYLPKR